MKSILLTGGTGRLGKAIIESGCFRSLLAPSREALDITKPADINKFFNNNDFDLIIHCAALARMKECQENPAKAIQTNITGTCNLVVETLKKEKSLKKSIRFIHISTDGVYQGTRGNYNENDETIPYNIYGWTKLGAECAINALSNFCIIRTSFFDPKNIKFDASAADSFSSRIEIGCLVEAIAKLANHNFVGTINVGGEKKSEYDHYKEFKPSLRSCSQKDILKTAGIPMAIDASMDCGVWETVKKNEKY